ncbi:MAG: hypothetical protein V1913_02930 [Fibrobacterota bacterium]
MSILKSILFSPNTTSARPAIVFLSCASLVALFSIAILEIVILVLGANGIFPSAAAAEWILRIKTSAISLLHGI